ncbi:MAG: hypothetical protein QXN59_00585 [Candidatus Micrarchaeaceae archaeon]
MMEIKILEDKDEKLLGRRSVKFSVAEDAQTVSKEEAKKELCKKLGTNPDLSIVYKVEQTYGVKQAFCYAHIYSSDEALKSSEPKYILSRLSKKSKKAEEPIKNGG